MAQTPDLPDFVQDGIERVEATVRRWEREGRKALKRVRQERRKIERQVETRRQSLVKQAEDFGKQLRKQVDTALASQPVATKSDLAKVDRKLAKLRRQLNALEKTKGRRAA